LISLLFGFVLMIEQISPANSPNPNAQNIIILNNSTLREGADYWVAGIALNNNSYPVDNIRIEIVGYDKNGNVVDKNDFIAQDEILHSANYTSSPGVDIQNNRPLQKPRIPGTAILDPRTGEQIYV
jgi:hypothetical protein